MGDGRSWYKIYLFYGLIFFLLGLAGWLLNKPRDLRGFAAEFDNFTADLRQYTDWDLNWGNHEVAVLARPGGRRVDFLYSAKLEEAGFAPVVRQCQTALRERFAYLELQMVKGDFDGFWYRWTAENQGRLVVGLNVFQPRPAEGPCQIELKFRSPDRSPASVLLQQAIALLADRSLLSLGLRSDNGLWLEIAWQEAGPNPTAIGKTIQSLLEPLSPQVLGPPDLPRLQ